LYMRFEHRNIYSTDNLDLVNYFDKLTCFRFFDANINDNDLNILNEKLKEQDIYFKYINNDSNILKQLKENGFNIKMINSWKSGQLYIPCGKFNDYCSKKSQNFRRLIKNYYKNSNNMKFVISTKEDMLSLWKDILYIDQLSWKYEEESDMLNMDYEHIQYLFLCLDNPNNIDITVAYLKNTPVAYSFLLKDNDIYYAVKWGATEMGRQHMGGICCLVNQIEKISSIKDLSIDFWGRNSEIYDKLKTHSINRVDFMIGR
ncbi:MAG: GNAT family N-acetyltransferase, partial [Bacilli bacterium]|nr:GNAT family N-acetyltransferase [Bacilli bacterium]